MRGLAGGEAGARLKLVGSSGADHLSSIYRYTAKGLPGTDPLITPYIYKWHYKNVGMSGERHMLEEYASEEELLAAVEAQRPIWLHRFCSATAPLEPDSGGWVILDGTHEPTSQWGQRLYWMMEETRPASCGYVRVERTRTVSCPVGYSGVYRVEPAPYCHPTLDVHGYISGRPIECPSTGRYTQVGNPCDAASGDKHQAEVDYSAAGLTLVRHHHSGALRGGSGLGAAWTHNFSSSVASGYLRGDGYVDSFQEFTDPTTSQTIYVARAGGQKMTLSGSEWSVRSRDGSTEVYQGNYLLRRVDAAGLTTTIQYGQQDTDPVTGRARISSVTGPFGHRLEFHYTADLLTSVTVPGGGSIDYTYQGENLVAIRYPDGHSRTYHYEDSRFPSYLTGITGEDGVRFATYEYDSVGRVSSSEHEGGAGRVSLDYQPSATLVTDALGAVSTYAFSEGPGNAQSRRLTGFSKNGLGESYTLSNDAHRRVTESTDARGNVTKFVYDNFHLLSRVEAFGTSRQRTAHYEYLSSRDDLITRETLLDAAGVLVRETVQTYNAQRLLWTRTIRGPSGVGGQVERTTTYTYYANGQLATVDGPRSGASDTTIFTYYNCTTGNACGRLNTVTNGLGQSITYLSYNAHGQPLSMTDPNGVMTTMTYDERQRLRSRSVAGETTSVDYWPTGLIKRVTLPDGRFLEYGYDAAHRLTEVRDGAGHRAVFTLDAMGNRTRTDSLDASNARTRTQRRVYDVLNRLSQEIGAANTANVTTTYGYDDNGNQTSIAAPLGRTTAQGYDELDRLTSVTDPLNGVTHYGYDALDRLTSVTDPNGLVTAYVYDALGDLRRQTSPDSGVTVNTYDSAGNLATRTDARGASVGRGTYTYDALNRVTQVEYPDHTVTYDYDNCAYGIGRLCSMTDTGGTTEYAYDAQGRVILKAQTASHGAGGLTQRREVHYTYTNGRLTRRQIRPGGIDVYYDHDAAGRISEIRVRIDDPEYPQEVTVLTDVLYDADGQILGWTWGNGQLTVREYDADGRPTLIDSHGQSSYTYDDAGRITSIVPDGSVQWNATPWWTYGYDKLDRVISASRPVGPDITRTYGYDANGNRTSQGGTDAVTFNYSNPLTSNRLASTSGALNRTYQYDAAGNRISDGITTFTYDGAGRMVASSAGNTTYGYNGLGVRTTKHIAGSLSGGHYVYDEAGHLIEKCTGTAALGNTCDKYTTQQIIWLDDIPVAVTLYTMTWDSEGYLESSFTELFQVHTDHLNTPRKLQRSGNTSQLAWGWWWGDPFGVGSAYGGFVTWVYPVFDLRFPGQVYDAETGLHYNYYRDYDPRTGRYVQSDPWGLHAGVNPYAYARANPLRFVDPFGLQEAPAAPAGDHVPKSPKSVTPDEARQKACDAAADANREEQAAQDARLNGDWNTFYDHSSRAETFWRNFYEWMGQPLEPFTPTPRGPTPPSPTAPDDSLVTPPDIEVPMPRL